MRQASVRSTIQRVGLTAKPVASTIHPRCRLTGSTKPALSPWSTHRLWVRVDGPSARQQSLAALAIGDVRCVD